MTASRSRKDDDAAASSSGGEVTIVLLTFNCAHRLIPTLTHLLSTRVPIVAVDNGSADATIEVLAQHPEITVIALPANIGAAARNVGAERATTPYVAFCDDDGWYDSDGLALASGLFAANPNVALLNARILVGSDEQLDPISAEMEASPVFVPDGQPGKGLFGFMAGAAIVRRDVFLDVGGYDARFFMGGEEECERLAQSPAWQRDEMDRLHPRGHPQER